MSKLLNFVMSDDADYSSLTREQLESCLAEVRANKKIEVKTDEIIKENIELRDKVDTLEEQSNYWFEEANKKHSEKEQKQIETNIILCNEVSNLKAELATCRARIAELERKVDPEEDYF